jgi:gamma-glutamylcyclotransferase (GGCT)/AIG2-like uncharacterized protein YtfP
MYKLYEKVIIVEKENGQAYVVEPENKKMLENARKWAVTNHNDGRGNYTQTVGKEYSYENKGFKLTLHSAAEYSWGQGKLSFWNCTITTPDNKEFLIGVNADLLLDLLKMSTFINGVCQEDLCFVRKSGRVGLVNIDSELYNKALEDNNTRTQSKTLNYKAGDIVKKAIPNSEEAYLGEVYQMYDISNHYITLFKKPKKVHLYVYAKYDGANTYLTVLEKKAPRLLTNEKREELTIDLIKDNALKSECHYTKLHTYRFCKDISDFEEVKLRELVKEYNMERSIYREETRIVHE